jgi:tRNA G26 N,N-dimethylase Trm1
MRPAAARAVLVVEAVSRTTSSSPSHAASSAIGINDNVGVEASVAAVNDDYDGHGCCHMSVFCQQIPSIRAHDALSATGLRKYIRPYLVELWKDESRRTG